MDKKPSKEIRAKACLLCLILTCALIQGCASSGNAKIDPARLAEFSPPAAGKAKVIFYRPKNEGRIDIGLHDGEQLVAKLSGKTYGVYECDPGEHVFSGSFGNLDIVDANLLPNRIYYVKAAFVLQMVGPAWVKMTPIDPTRAAKDWQELPNTLANLRKTIVTPEQMEHDRKGIVGYMERYKTYREKPGAVFEKILPEYGQSTPLSAR